MAKRQSSRSFVDVRGRVPKKSPTPRAAGAKKRADSTSGGSKRSFQQSKPGWPRGLSQLVSGGGYFWERQAGGQRIREGLGRIESIAIERAAILNRDVERGEYRPHSAPGQSITLARFVEAALESKSNLAKKTRQDYRARSKLLLRYVAECYPRANRLVDLTSEIAAEYPAWRAEQDTTRCGWRADTTPLRKPSPQTIRDEIGRFRTLLKFGVRKGWISNDPFANVGVQRRSGEKADAHNPLSQEEQHRLLKAAKKYDRLAPRNGVHSTYRGHIHDITTMFLLTGLRKAELISLPWQHVRFDWDSYGIIDVKPFEIAVPLRICLDGIPRQRADGLAATRSHRGAMFKNAQQMRSVVPSHYRPTQSENWTTAVEDLMALRVDAWDTKTGILTCKTMYSWRQKASAGSVPLTPTSRRLLDRRAKAKSESPFVFAHPNGGPIRSDYWEQFKRLLRMAGLSESYRVHDLRHSFGMSLRRKGVPLESIMGLMRHKDIKETLIYAKYSDEEGAAQIVKIDTLSG